MKVFNLQKNPFSGLTTCFSKHKINTKIIQSYGLWANEYLKNVYSLKVSS